MTKEELDKVLESHKKWLHGNCCGKRAVSFGGCFFDFWRGDIF